MDTTAAALQANVTTATIRTWCRRGVVTAIKQAGRWTVDASSLAARIVIGAMRTRKATHVIDLNATYSGQLLPDEAPRTFTVMVKQRVSPDGEHLTVIRSIIPLLADKLDAIADPGDRIASLNALAGAQIVISDTAHDDWEGDPIARERGLLRTTYRGGAAGISVDDVFELAAQIRTQLAA